MRKQDSRVHESELSDVDPAVEDELNAMQPYKASEKRWKRADVGELYSDTTLIDLAQLQPDYRKLVRQVGSFRSRPIFAFDAFGEAHEGFYVIPNALNSHDQLDLAHKCLTEYANAPHVTNMRQQQCQVDDIWRKALVSHPHDPSSSPLMKKLHWSACGYHYDWTAREYHDWDYSDIPPRLADIGAECAVACGETLKAEAVIVNFYAKSSTMGGHQDDVELTMNHPVVSVSLGCSAVFLKGGHTKDTKPLEVLLRSGDIAIMAGNSRLSVHGVAKVFPSDPQDDCGTMQNEDELDAVRKYLETHRININIRQVYPKE